MLDTLAQEPWVQHLGWTLLHSLWQLFAIAALAAFFLRQLRNSSPNVRYVACVSGLILMAILPLATLALLMAQARWTGQALSQAAARDVESSRFDVNPRIESGASAARSDDGSTPGAVNASTVTIVRNLLDRLHPFIVTLWAAAVATSLLLRTVALSAAWRMCRVGAAPIGGELAERFRALARRLGIHRPVALLKSTLAKTPMVIGCLRPVILIPASGLTGLSLDEVEAILAHELAHIRRQDYLVDMLLGIVPTLFCYHPAVWWLRGRLLAEREAICDDTAVAACGRTTYLAALEFFSDSLPSAAPAQAATGAAVLDRVRRLAGLEAERKQGGAWFIVVGLIVAAALTGAISACSPSAAVTEPPKTVAPKESAVFPSVAVDAPVVPFEDLESFGEHGRDIQLNGHAPLAFTDELGQSDKSDFFIVHVKDWDRPLAVTIVPLTGKLAPYLKATWIDRPGVSESNGDIGHGHGGRPWQVFDKLLPPPDNLIRLDVYRKAPDAPVDWNPSGSYAVCLWRPRSASDADPDTIGLTATPMHFDASGIARPARLSIEDWPAPPTAFDYPGDIDVFQLTPLGQGWLEVTAAAGRGSSATPLVCAFDSTARRLTDSASRDAQGRPTLSFFAKSREPIFLVLTAANGQITGPYDLCARVHRTKRGK